MRFVLVSLLATVASANESCDQKEQVSMLQTKDRLGLSGKEHDLIKAVTEASPMFEHDVQVGHFLDGVKKTVVGMKEADGKEALLQRASQSKRMQELIGRFQSLPVENRDKLTEAGGDIFEKLPVAQRSALVQQVSHALDEATEGKAETTQFEDSTGKKCTKTEDRQTGFEHKHCHGQFGTETTSRGKYGGHEHKHSYSHNGQGGNAETETETKGMGGHTHRHEHRHTLDRNGNTRTETETESSGNGWSHGHEHNHEHRPGDGTDSDTWSRSNGDTHKHSHNHKDPTGNHVTSSSSWEGGRKVSGHSHHHNQVGSWQGNGHGNNGKFDN